MTLSTKRWNDPINLTDGLRILVCRYRPRGLRKEDETWDIWYPQLGPSKKLHADAYGKNLLAPIPYSQYKKRFLKEMKQKDSQKHIIELSELIRAGKKITLLCSSACLNADHCHRTLLKQMILNHAFKSNKRSNRGVTKSNKIVELYKKLSKKYGRLKWWSHEDPFEILVGAILVQNTNWKNADKGINNLKANNVFSAEAMQNIPLSRLKKLIKSSGLYNQKAQRLKEISKWYQSKENLNTLKHTKTRILRNELISIKGIGNETADAILLYGFNRPTFVIDAYTQRLLIKLKLIKNKMKYDDLQKIFHESLPINSKLYRQFHALIIHHSQLTKKFDKI